MKRNLNIIVVALLSIMMLTMLTGCPSPDPNAGGVMKTFIGGAQGVTVDFDLYAPPDEVSINEEFNMMLVLQNMGEYTVPAGDYFVRVRGLGPDFSLRSTDDLKVIPQEELPGYELQPDTGDIIESYKVYVEVPQDGAGGYPIAYTGSLAGNQPFTINADVCYTYQTEASALLCVKEKLTRTQDTSVCRLGGTQPVASSAGPIQIANFNEFGAGEDKVRFSFTVTEGNIGGYSSEADSGCNKNQAYLGQVWLRIDTGLNGLSCTGLTGGESERISGGTFEEGFVKLSGSTRTIQCTQDLTGQHATDYQKVVGITARYDYQQTISGVVTVKHIA